MVTPRRLVLEVHRTGPHARDVDLVEVDPLEASRRRRLTRDELRREGHPWPLGGDGAAQQIRRRSRPGGVDPEHVYRPGACGSCPAQAPIDPSKGRESSPPLDAVASERGAAAGCSS